ncbi:MAG: electron transporter RnfC, partial [Desulfuromonadales bacterium C00003096]
HIPWPEFTIFNQQGNRWVQNRYVVVFPDGNAIYLERFSTTLQAPDFNFRHFPFDRQQFAIRIDNIYPEEFFLFQPMENFNEVGTELGEEEWVVIDSATTVTSDLSSSLRPVSRFNFEFNARRQLTYYIFRIFLPLFVIISVSWIIFFSKDYAKRVDVAGTNLLIFVAFNFTVSGDLPRLGYLTFMDSIIVSGFLVTSLVLVFNVIIRRLELTGMINWVQKIDTYMLWIYPLFYLAAVVGVTMLFD